MLIAVLILQITILVAVLGLILTYVRLRNKKDSEYYTDYHNGKLILRIFKPEYEYQAIGNVQRGKILDRGTLSQFYFWALIES